MYAFVNKANVKPTPQSLSHVMRHKRGGEGFRDFIDIPNFLSPKIENNLMMVQISDIKSNKPATV